MAAATGLTAVASRTTVTRSDAITARVGRFMGSSTPDRARPGLQGNLAVLGPVARCPRRGGRRPATGRARSRRLGDARGCARPTRLHSHPRAPRAPASNNLRHRETEGDVEVERSLDNRNERFCQPLTPALSPKRRGKCHERGAACGSRRSLALKVQITKGPRQDDWRAPKEGGRERGATLRSSGSRWRIIGSGTARLASSFLPQIWVLLLAAG